MRVLITSDVFPPDAGGPATYVPLVARELARRGHAVRVLTYSCVRREAADGALPFAVDRIPVRGSRPVRLLRTFVQLAASARQADVLFFNGLLIEGAVANLLTRRPVVAKVVGDIAWERARDKGWITDEFEDFQRRCYGWRVELRRALRTWALRRARAVITPSAYLKRIAIGWGVDPNRMHVIYNALGPDASRGPLSPFPLQTKYRAITVCRLASWKGVDGLIEAIAARPEVGLAVIGEGPERANLEALAHRLMVGERVFFAGQVSRPQVGAYLQACHLFVLNSRYEGLPHVVLEAMAAGLPIVAADAGGVAEVVRPGVNGILVPPGDTDALQRAISTALDDADLRARCAATKEDARRRFSAQLMTDATEEVLQEVKGRAKG